MKPLTKRQSQTLFHLCQGLSDKEIGAKLGISQNTVQVMVKAIHRRFETRNRTQTVLKFMNYKPELHEIFVAYDNGYKNGSKGDKHLYEGIV